MRLDDLPPKLRAQVQAKLDAPPTRTSPAKRRRTRGLPVCCVRCGFVLPDWSETKTARHDAVAHGSGWGRWGLVFDEGSEK